MTAIPAKTSFTGASVTEGGFKSSIEQLHDFLTEILGSAGINVPGMTLTDRVRIETDSVVIVMQETDQTLPAGLWRIHLAINKFRIERNTAVAGDFSTTVTVFEIDTSNNINISGVMNQEAWITPTFTNSWVNFGASRTSAQYYKDKQGRVHLKGAIKDGTLNAAAFTLPSGYRPDGTIFFPVDGNGAYGRLSITAAGVVTPVSGSTTSMSLDGVSFQAV